jgi:hypothetical protein
MLSLFTIPKPFAGHIDTIQRNALESWRRIEPRPEILVFGDETGAAEAAARVGARHLPELQRNEYGTPVLGEVFERAQATATQSFMCYANADIVFLEDLVPAIAAVARAHDRFLLCGRRWNIEQQVPLDFGERWRETLRQRLPREAELQDGWWVDYFVFPRGLWATMPPFLVGRPAWDNWLVYDACRRGVPVIDATEAVTVVHQRHDYAHVPRSTGDHWRGPESDYNLSLAGGRLCTYSLADASHRLTPAGLKRNVSLQPFRRIVDRWEAAGGVRGVIASGARRLGRLRGA